jgi:hypothetical protein
MKKLVFIIIALFFILNLFSEQMSLGTVQTVAQNWYSNIYETENNEISNYTIETSKGLQTAFIFNFVDGGFVITSASNDAEPILAYNDIGGITSDRSPSLEWLINCYNDQIYEIIEDRLFHQPHRDTWLQLIENTYTEDRTEVLLPMDPTWNQGAPYNNFAPLIDGNRCVAGCGPIAMAQMINYNKYLSDYYFSNEFVEPNYSFMNSIPGIYEIDEDALIYDFPTFEALDPYLSDIRELYNTGNSIDYNDGFAALSFACGIGLRAMYDSSTGTYGGINIVRSYAKNFGYKSDHYSRNDYQGNWEALLINEINNDRVIQYKGSDPDAGAHAFILQGYVIGPPAIPCFYVNWGWGHSPNNSDGWYTLDNLNPILTNYSFTENQGTIINIEPVPLTIVGQLFAVSPEFAGSVLIGPIGFVDIELTYTTPSHPFGIIVVGDYCSVVDGSYYIQLNEQLPIGTEFQITITSTNYETKTFNGEVTTDSNVLFMEKMELFWKFKPLFDGWNWESFPVLDRTGNDPVSAIPVLEEMEDFPEDIVNISVLNNGPIGYNQGYGELYFDAFQMLWFPQSGYELQSTRCHKIKVLPEIGLGSFRTLEIEGTTLDQTAPIDLITGQDNWIGYWVKARQDIDDAFGEDFDKVKSIKAEDWEWKDMRPERGPFDPVPTYYPIRPLNYGKGYVVRVKEDILGFQWNVSGEIGSQYKRKTTESFTYEEKSDYESIIIDSISGGGYITEIGVFENDICVGASVVDSLPLQILAYTDAVNRGGNLTFQVSYSSNRGYQSVKSYSVLNLDEGTFENKLLILGTQKHNIIQLYLEGDEEDIPISTNLTLYSNYPNPFNPSTKISFSLLEDSEVSLKVFNVKGQVVKTLLKKQIEAGEHIITWEGKDKNNKQVSSGIYFYKISTSKETKVNKMLLLK